MYKLKLHDGVFFGILLSAGIFSSIANAEEAAPYAFIGGSVGYQLADDDNYKYSDPGAVAWGISSGVHFNDSWRWDLGFQLSQPLEAKKNGISVEPRWWETAIRYDWELPSDFSVYTRVGIAYWDMEKEIKNQENLSSKGVSPLVEAGIGYQISPRFSVDGGFKYIDQIGDRLTGQYDSSSFNVSLNYRFLRAVQAVTVPQEYVEIAPTTVVITEEQIEERSFNLPFEFASSEVDVNNPKLLEVLDILLEHPNSRIILIGHTDSVGSIQANFFLSEKRANRVSDYLISHGIERSRITVKGAGERDPIASNATPEGRQQNIRVEMTIPEFTQEVESDLDSASLERNIIQN